VRHLPDFDRAGHLRWVSEEMRQWALARARATAQQAHQGSGDARPQSTSSTAPKSFYKKTWFIVTAVFTVLALIGVCVFAVIGLSRPSSPSGEPDIVVDSDWEFYADAARVFNSSNYGPTTIKYMVQADIGTVYASIGRAADYPDQALVTAVLPNNSWAMQWLFSPYDSSGNVLPREVDFQTLPQSVKNWNATVLDDGTLVVGE